MADAAQKPAPAVPRDAATLVLLREGASGGEARVLMGQRGGGASFMPNKVVFPGGAVDAADRAFRSERPLREVCRARLLAQAPEDLAEALALAAIRETFEETGLLLGEAARAAPAEADDTSDDTSEDTWNDIAALGAAPAVDRLRFFFRAITPPSLPKRFDARFFLAPADAVMGDPDDFSAASGELSHLAWTPLSEAEHRPLPFVTHVVIVELIAAIERMGLARLLEEGLDRPVPFFAHGVTGATVEGL